MSLRPGLYVRHLCDVCVALTVAHPPWHKGASGTAIRYLEGPCEGTVAIVFTDTLALVSPNEDPMLRCKNRLVKGIAGREKLSLRPKNSR